MKTIFVIIAANIIIFIPGCFKENKHFHYLVRSINSGNRYIESFSETHANGDTVSINDGWNNIPAIVEKKFDE